jgi:hypothetical protein
LQAMAHMLKRHPGAALHAMPFHLTPRGAVTENLYILITETMKTSIGEQHRFVLAPRHTGVGTESIYWMCVGGGY